MTEDQQASAWMLLMIGFIAGLVVGMLVISICAGWYDEIMEIIAKKKKKGR